MDPLFVAWAITALVLAVAGSSFLWRMSREKDWDAVDTCFYHFVMFLAVLAWPLSLTVGVVAGSGWMVSKRL